MENVFFYYKELELYEEKILWEKLFYVKLLFHKDTHA